jgi:hypothetical protein
MALVRFNPAIMALRGKVDDWVYRLWYGKPVRQRIHHQQSRVATQLLGVS